MSDIKDLLRRYKFELVDGEFNTLGGFLGISPISLGIRTSKYREGDDDNLEGITLPGRRITEPIEIRRGCFVITNPEDSESDKIHYWINKLQKGEVADGEISEEFGGEWYIRVKKKTTNEFGRIYKILNPIITLVRTAELDSMDSVDDVVWIESIVIEHSGIDLVTF
ncbi:MAG: hypothetical protein EOM67_00420 [Spirochaetia bacterium]|nr:hypothetical protein [Spirochaetia bacterium]